MKSARISANARSNKSPRTARDNADHVYRVIEIVGTSEPKASDNLTEDASW